MTMAADQALSGLGARLVHNRPEAIGEIYVALGSTVRSYLHGLVGPDDADDVLQRVLYEVWRHNSRYDPSRSLAAWVLGIARKRAIDHLRRRRHIAVPLDDLDDVAGEDGRELAERYARAREVRDALNRLPDEQREVLVLAYFGRFTQSEIATLLEVPLGTVKARAFRGLRRLAHFLGPDQQVTEPAHFASNRAGHGCIRGGLATASDPASESAGDALVQPPARLVNPLS